MIESITGVILAGGKSSRMGKDKALLPYRGRPLIQNVLDTMQNIFSRVVLSIRTEMPLAQKIPQIPDRYPDTGPLGGIASALMAEKTEIFCVACDMPFLNPHLIQFLCRLDGFDAVVPVWAGQLQVLHAKYSPSLLPDFEIGLNSGQFKISDAFSKSKIRFVPENEIRPLDPAGVSFRNVNTPIDYDEILRS